MQVIDVTVQQVEWRSASTVELVVNINLSDAILHPTNIPDGWVVAYYYDDRVVLNGIPNGVTGTNSAFTTARMVYSDFNVNSGDTIAKAFIF